MRTIAILISLAAGCIEDPSDAAIAITAEGQATAPADGASLVTLTIDAETDADVVLTASSGSFVGAAAPAGGAPATLSIKTGRGARQVEYRAGLDVGAAIITASSGVFSSTTEIALTPSLPARLVLAPNRTSVTGDGVSFVELQTSAITTAPALVSHGTLLEYAICCVSSDRLPITCNPGDEPLTIPALARIDDGRQITLRAVSTKLTAARAAVVVARVAAARTTSPCGAIEPDEIRSNVVRIDVVP